MTCADHPYSSPLVVGFDPEPQGAFISFHKSHIVLLTLNKALSIILQSMVIPDIAKSISTVMDLDQQAYLYRDIPANWSEFQHAGINNYLGGTFAAPYVYNPGLRYYVTAFPNNTNTGILREHIMRLNSTAECTTIPESSFPESCGGPDPLTPSYDAGGVKIDICVPGNMSASPWGLSRDRLDISEDMYIKLHIDYDTWQSWGPLFSLGFPVNFTVHCTANTTRGYFELPNWTNNFLAGKPAESAKPMTVQSLTFNTSRIRSSSSYMA